MRDGSATAWPAHWTSAPVAWGIVRLRDRCPGSSPRQPWAGGLQGHSDAPTLLHGGGSRQRSTGLQWTGVGVGTPGGRGVLVASSCGQTGLSHICVCWHGGSGVTSCHPHVGGTRETCLCGSGSICTSGTRAAGHRGSEHCPCCPVSPAQGWPGRCGRRRGAQGRVPGTKGTCSVWNREEASVWRTSGTEHRAHPSPRPQQGQGVQLQLP